MFSRTTLFLALISAVCFVNFSFSMNRSKSKIRRKKNKVYKCKTLPKVKFGRVGKSQKKNEYIKKINSKIFLLKYKQKAKNSEIGKFENRKKDIFFGSGGKIGLFEAIKIGFFEDRYVRQLNQLEQDLDNKIKENRKKNISSRGYPYSNKLAMRKQNINKIDRLYKSVSSKLYRSGIILSDLLFKMQRLVKLYDNQKNYSKSREIKNLVMSKDFQKDMSSIKERLKKVEYNKKYKNKCVLIWGHDYWFKNVYSQKEAQKNFSEISFLSKSVNSLYQNLVGCCDQIKKEVASTKVKK